MLRLLPRILLGLVLLVIAFAIIALCYRAWRQHENAVALAIATPNGIDERIFVHVNGIDQYVTIRGEDRSNPVLLILAGGPGNSLVPLGAVFRKWEKYFTVVQWDQRGAGKTFEANGEAGEGPMTVDQMTQDGLKIAEFLRNHLHKDKIIVLGHSWGTTLGVRMVKARPDYFFAYVGTGQVVGKEDKELFVYNALMKKVRAAQDAEAIAELQRIGVPPYKSQRDLIVERDVSLRYDTQDERDLYSKMTPVVLFAPNYTLLDIYYLLRFGGFAGDAMYPELIAYDARKLGPDFALPVFIFNGEKDAVTPTVLAQDWFATVRAPKKTFVILKGGGHGSILTMSDAFLDELVMRVRPVAK